MNFYPDHPLQAFWNLAAAPIQSRALALALAQGLFDSLAQPATANRVAQRLGLHPTGAAVWLDLLWSMGLLSRSVAPATPRTEPEYGVSTLASRFFAAGSAGNCAAAWQYRAGVLGSFATQLDGLLRDGRDDEFPPGNWAQAAQTQIDQEQRAITVPAVLQKLDDWRDLPERGRFLDLGGGPGHVAIALARRLPHWRGTVCDLPYTVPVAQDNIRRAALSARLDTLGCDLNRDAIGSGYDLIWCSSVLHFLDDPQAGLRMMLEALNPGGLLVTAHAEISEDAAVAARVLPFYAPMMLRGRYVPRAGDIVCAMERAGFRNIRALGRADFPMTPLWLYSGRRP